MGRAALLELRPQLDAYEKCAVKHMKKRELTRAPDSYTAQLPKK